MQLVQMREREGGREGGERERELPEANLQWRFNTKGVNQCTEDITRTQQ